MSISNYAELKILDAVFNNVSFVVPSTFVKLHVGDPGEDGTANAAGHTTRLAATWTTAASGSVNNEGAVTFTPLAATETITHISIWDTVGPAGGNCLWSGPLNTPQNVNVGGTLNFAIGTIVVTLN